MLVGRQRRNSLCLLSLLCFLCFSHPFAGAPTDEVLRFAVIGDSGTGKEGQYRVARQMAAWHDRLPFELVLMLGDNIYGGLFGSGGGNQKDFEAKFDRPYAELLRRGVVFRAALGNHDMRRRDGQDLIDSYDRFHIAGPQGYYNFTAGQAPDGAPLIEFFVLNSIRLEKDKRDPEQLAWLEQALAASHARWRIAYFHHPLYSTGKHHGPDAKLRAKLEPLFRDRVQVVFSGHDHIYQRLHPQQGILYFVVGSSGQLRRGNARRSPLVAAVNDQTRAFLLVEARPEALSFYAVDDAGQAFDCAALAPGATVSPLTCPAGASAEGP